MEMVYENILRRKSQSDLIWNPRQSQFQVIYGCKQHEYS